MSYSLDWIGTQSSAHVGCGATLDPTQSVAFGANPEQSAAPDDAMTRSFELPLEATSGCGEAFALQPLTSSTMKNPASMGRLMRSLRMHDSHLVQLREDLARETSRLLRRHTDWHTGARRIEAVTRRPDRRPRPLCYGRSAAWARGSTW